MERHAAPRCLQTRQVPGEPDRRYRSPKPDPIVPRIRVAQRPIGILSLLLLLATPSLRTKAAEPPSLLHIHDSGAERQFEIARDEHWVERRRELVKATPDQTASATGSTQLVVYEKGKARNEFTRRIVTHRVLIRATIGADVKAIAARCGAAAHARVPFTPDCFVLESTSSGGALELSRLLRTEAGIRQADVLLKRQRYKRLIPNDPYFGRQWHLQNTGQQGATTGADINVVSAWDRYRGQGVTIGIVDDGVQTAHPDLAANHVSALGIDINDNDNDPNPDPRNDSHGTAVAGVAAARGNNGVGVAGVAYEASLAGIRMIAAPTSDADEAKGLLHENGTIAIYNNSWGPNDSGDVLEAPGTLTTAALKQGAEGGRGGLGSIFAWAGGNGGENGDNSNYDGYANSIYTLAVGALTDTGARAEYSEPGANLVISAPAGGGNSRPQGTTTTDLTGKDGYNDSSGFGGINDANYTGDFGGTSSATPVVAGAVALLLQANPGLGWRDVQEILMRSATKTDPGNGDWINNAAGFQFNHNFGAGRVNVGAAIALATNWVNLGTAFSRTAEQTGLNVAIPDNDPAGVVRELVVTDALRLEHVTVTADIGHLRRGDLEITLIAPTGTESVLAEPHNDSAADYPSWRFMTVRNWGESPVGTWRVRIADRQTGSTGNLRSLRLELHGSDPNDSSATNQPPRILVGPANQTVDTGAAASFSVAVAGTPPYTYQWQKDGIDLANGGRISGATNSLLRVAGVVTNDAGSYRVRVSNEHGEVTSDAASLTVVPVITLAQALDTTAMTWTTGGNAPWEAQTDVTQDGTDAAAAPDLNDDQESWIETQVDGPGALHWFWRVSSEADYDFLELMVNGQVVSSISGNVDWTVASANLTGSGRNILRWRFRKDAIVSEGADRGWVDQVRFVPAADSAPVIVMQPADVTALAGSTATLKVGAEGTSPLSYQWSKASVALPKQTNANLTLGSVTTNDAGSYTVTISNRLGSVTSNPAQLTVVEGLSLAEALDATEMAWTTGGDAPWIAQTAVNSDGTDAAASGDLNDDQTSWIETQLPGPGELRWQWKASTEADFDLLEFLVDNQVVRSISGEVDWTGSSYRLTNNQAQVVRWRYRKDNIVSTGQDRGWVDQIRFTPHGGTAPVIMIGPTNFTAIHGATVSFNVTATGTGPLGYRWRRDGVALNDGAGIAGADSATLTLSNVSRRTASTYSVQVTNSFGSVLSTKATLRVLVPQVLSSVMLPTEGRFQIRFGDIDGARMNLQTAANLVIQTSRDLVTWVDLNPGASGISVVNNQLQFEDPDVIGHPQRFYRIIER